MANFLNGKYVHEFSQLTPTMERFAVPKLLAFLALFTIHHFGDTFASFTPHKNYGTHRFKPEFHNLEIHQTTGDIYIGATNWIFQLDSNLNLLSSFKTAPEDYYADCYGREACEEDGDNINRLLVANYKIDELIACDAVTSGCVGLKLSNVSVLVRNFSSGVVTGNRDNFALVEPLSEVLYVGAGGRLPAISSYSLETGQNLSLVTQEPTDISTKDRDFIYGFRSQGFTYFVVKAWSKGADVFTLVRVNGYSESEQRYDEIQFACRSAAGHEYQILNGVQILKPGGDLAADLKLNEGDDVLFAMFSSDGAKTESALCMYSMKNVSRLTEAKKKKIVADAAVKFDDHVTVFTATSVGDATVVFMGTHNAMFKKVLLSRGTSGLVGIQYEEERLMYPLSFKFQMALAPTGQHLYFMTSRIIFKILLYNCSKFSTLETCAGAGDPYCGWCNSTSLCTSKANCKTRVSSAHSWITCTSMHRRLPNPRDSVDPAEEPQCYCPAIYLPPGVLRSSRCEAPPPWTPDDPALKIIIGVSAGVVTVGLILATLIIVRRLNSQEESYRKALQVFLNGDEDAALTLAENPAERSHFVPFNLTIPPEDINMNGAKQIGSGQFGAVYVAQYKSQPTAVKVVKHGSNQEQMLEFLKEIKTMAYIGHHPNIVRLIGAEVSQLERRGVLVVLELSVHGDLEKYLRKNINNYVHVPELARRSGEENEIIPLVHLGLPTEEPRLGFRNLADWCRQIASGLAYLGEKQIVHGDVAARNVLLFEDNIVKVSDFGFSRKTYGTQYTKTNRQTPLPFRWLAPETLDQMVFTPKTDVWAYGVTCWEIFTLGNCPFANETWTMTFKNRLRSGMRLEKPRLATEQIYQELMSKCWELNPDERPDFREICEFWSLVLDEMEVANCGVGGGSRYAELEFEEEVTRVDVH